MAEQLSDGETCIAEDGAEGSGDDCSDQDEEDAEAGEDDGETPET